MFEFERELDRVNRDKSQGGLLIMIDLDNFKSINDTYGHDAGDAALKLVANALSTDIRRMDVAGRMGGDEFVILFVNTDRKQALERAQFLIKKLNNLSFVWHGEEIPVRASIGLENYNKGDKSENIFRAADQSMYGNKKQIKSANARQDNKRM
jgi:diguanylate cyclase (GGDEF)-like protein